MENSGLNKSNSTNKDQTDLVFFLLQRHKNGRLNKCAIDEAMKLFSIQKHSNQAHINGSNDHVVGAIPDGMDMISDLMDCLFKITQIKLM